MGVFRQQTSKVQARIREAVIEAARRHLGPGGIIIPSPACLFAARKPVRA